MILVIDGYNLLKAIFPRVKGKLDKQRDQLVRQLGFYKKQQEGSVKEIVLVFDGGLTGRATREVKKGVVVVFSGRDRSADDWIVDYVERCKGFEIILVSRDRELINRCKKKNVGVVRGEEFYSIVQTKLLEEVEKDVLSSGNDGGVVKYGRSDNEVSEVDSEALDLLMEQSQVDYKKEEDVFEDDSRKKGSSKKMSKEEKSKLRKLKKLY